MSTWRGHRGNERTGLLEAADTLKHYYNSIQKNDEHIRHEEAPRP